MLWWICTRRRNLQQCSMWEWQPSTWWLLMLARTHWDILQHASTSPHVWRFWDRYTHANAYYGPYCKLNPILGIEVHMPVFLHFTFMLCTKVFIQGNADESTRVLRTILEQRRLCPLISPFFTPNSAPSQLVFLYQDVVTSLDLSSADVIFMLLTKVRSHAAN